MKISGIYAIVNTVNNKRYVGSSINIECRFRQHELNLRKNTHTNKRLQHSWNIHGRENFNFVILEECCLDQLLEREQVYINERSEYNIRKNAWANYGISPSEETRKKQSDSRKGRKFTEEHKANMSRSFRGRKLSSEACKNISEAAKGRPSAFKGRKHSDESRQKMSEVQKGHKGHPHTPEELRKMSLAQLGRKHSEETRRKMSDIQKGRKRTWSKLSEDKVREMRKLHADGSHPYGKLAEMFNVSKGAVAFVIRRVSWKDVK